VHYFEVTVTPTPGTDIESELEFDRGSSISLGVGIASEEFNLENSTSGWIEENQGIGYYNGTYHGCYHKLQKNKNIQIFSVFFSQVENSYFLEKDGTIYSRGQAYFDSMNQYKKIKYRMGDRVGFLVDCIELKITFYINQNKVTLLIIIFVLNFLGNGSYFWSWE
jgi:hypothetical protein